MKMHIILHFIPGNKDTHGLNSKRLAEVWMDGYKRLFYMHRHELAVSNYLHFLTLYLLIVLCYFKNEFDKVISRFKFITDPLN